MNTTTESDSHGDTSVIENISDLVLKMQYTGLDLIHCMFRAEQSQVPPSLDQLEESLEEIINLATKAKALL